MADIDQTNVSVRIAANGTDWEVTAKLKLAFGAAEEGLGLRYSAWCILRDTEPSFVRPILAAGSMETLSLGQQNHVLFELVARRSGFLLADLSGGTIEFGPMTYSPRTDPELSTQFFVISELGPFSPYDTRYVPPA